jgi:hypothetical protein
LISRRAGQRGLNTSRKLLALVVSEVATHIAKMVVKRLGIFSGTSSGIR